MSLLTKKEIKEQIRAIIQKHVKEPHYKVFLFGSRVIGTADPRSDYDIGIQAEKRLSFGIMEDIRGDLNNNIRALQKFDLVDFCDADPDFKEIALQKTEEIYEK